jgi:hypothetical protein
MPYAQNYMGAVAPAAYVHGLESPAMRGCIGRSLNFTALCF